MSCGKNITYKYHTEDNFSETKIGILGKCGDLKEFPNKDWKERILCKECKQAVKDTVCVPESALKGRSHQKVSE